MLGSSLGVVGGLQHPFGIGRLGVRADYSGDQASWWDSHRPLVLQTTALAPICVLREYAGFRDIEVVDNVIDRTATPPTQDPEPARIMARG